MLKGVYTVAFLPAGVFSFVDVCGVEGLRKKYRPPSTWCGRVLVCVFLTTWAYACGQHPAQPTRRHHYCREMFGFGTSVFTGAASSARFDCCGKSTRVQVRDSSPTTARNNFGSILNLPADIGPGAPLSLFCRRFRVARATAVGSHDRWCTYTFHLAVSTTTAA